MYTTETKFRPSVRVRVKALKIEGFIEDIIVRRKGVIDYDVSFWYDGKRCCECVHEDELDEIN